MSPRPRATSDADILGAALKRKQESKKTDDDEA